MWENRSHLIAQSHSNISAKKLSKSVDMCRSYIKRKVCHFHCRTLC